MPARRARLLPLLASLLLGCAASAGVGGGGAGVEVRGRTGAAPAGERTERRMCMYDRASGQLRSCLHFSFGRCAMFGDRCSNERREPAPDPAAPPVEPARR